MPVSSCRCVLLAVMSGTTVIKKRDRVRERRGGGEEKKKGLIQRCLKQHNLTYFTKSQNFRPQIVPISHCSDENIADKLARQYLTVAKISVMLYNDAIICGIYGWVSIIFFSNTPCRVSIIFFSNTPCWVSIIFFSNTPCRVSIIFFSNTPCRISIIFFSNTPCQVSIIFFSNTPCQVSIMSQQLGQGTNCVLLVGSQQSCKRAVSELRCCSGCQSWCEVYVLCRETRQVISDCSGKFPQITIEMFQDIYS